jgi:uncharacterized protein (TIGR03067 family)
MPRLSLAACFLLASTALSAEPEGDLKAFQGAWVVAEATLAGRDHTDDFKDMRLKITGEKYEIAFDTNSDKGTIKLDSAKKPKEIDLTTQPGGPFKGRNLPGIYELKGDTIILCLEADKNVRPTKFEAPEKTRFMLFVLKREKK